MRLEELLELKHEYEIQTVSDYIALTDRITSRVNIDLNNGSLFKDIFSLLNCKMK